MKEKQIIWTLFDALRPIIISKLLNPEVSVSSRGQTFFYDGIDSTEGSNTVDMAQLIVPLNDEMAEVLSPDEFFTAHPSEYHNVWYVYPDKDITLPLDGWQQYIILTLKTDNRQNYMLCISLMFYGNNHVASHGQVMASGSIARITQTVRSNKFPGEASAIFKTCLETVARKIEESERHAREVNLFVNTNITDYDSVMKFVDNLKDKKEVLKSNGHGMEVFTYDHVVSLIDKSSKRVNVLVDRDGKAQFCSLEDFPTELLNMIRLEKRDWNLEVYNLSVGHFNSNGQAFVTWIISPYYYCPMDEDGFGEEEEYEVAVTCHINTDGHLTDTPVWKPYTGPRK